MNNYNGELKDYLEKFSKDGKQFGIKDEPKSDIAYPDEREAKAQLLANQFITQEKQLFSRAIKTFNDAFSAVEKRVSAAEVFLEHFTESNSLKNEAEIEIQKSIPIQSKLILNRKQWQRSLHKFQDDNDIHVPPIAPDSFLLGVGIIMLCACIEIALNAVFFLDSEGLPTALMISLGLSILSMGFSAVLGLLIRYKNLKDLKSLLIGWGAFVAFIFLLIYTNAVFSKFRTLFYLQGDMNSFKEASVQALHIFWGDYSFDDLYSYVLFGLGILLMGFACFKGNHLFPKYPGYFEINEKLEEALNDENSNVSELNNRISQLYGLNIQELKQAIELPTTAKKGLNDCYANLSLAFKNYSNSLNSIHQDFVTLISQYRKANQAVPGRTKVPDYFKDEIPKLFDIEADARIVDEKKLDKDDLLVRIQNLVDNPERLISQERNIKDELVSVLQVNLPNFIALSEQEADRLATLKPSFTQ
jgi:hypothetical protein